MNVQLSPKDWLAISAHLDGRLNPKETSKLESRLNSDAAFKQAYQELEYTRSMLQALPKRRAPRNFTLSTKTAALPARKPRVQPFFGLASAAATLALTLLFAVQSLVPMLARPKAAEPMLAAAPVANESALDATTAQSTPPMIIFWGQGYFADGKGGGGGMGGGDGQPATTLGLPPVEQPAAGPTPTPAAAVQKVDPSTLILGLPQPEAAAANELRESATQPLREGLPASTIWMIGLASFALLSGLLAFLLRKR